jgi:hypothetical protein
LPNRTADGLLAGAGAAYHRGDELRANSAASKARSRWRRPLLVAAIAVALGSLQPWIQVQFERLFGSGFGPPAWQSSAGFTCLCSSALVALLALAETNARETQRAARPASLLLVVVSCSSFLWHAASGPGSLRGVSARFTLAFWLTASALLPLLLATTVRWRRFHHA